MISRGHCICGTQLGVWTPDLRLRIVKSVRSADDPFVLRTDLPVFLAPDIWREGER